MVGIRRDIAKLGGPWSPTMLWYARAVGELRGRAFDQRTSWTYLAAIHGIDPEGWVGQGILAADTPAPPQAEMRQMFNQCQHAGWFFLPWHRGYLHALEAVLADWIVGQGGPEDWALPYWNYLDGTNPTARDYPREFLDAELPDGEGDNPLAQARRGPARRLGPQPWVPVDVTLTAQAAESVYTSDPGTLGYGGPISGFAQQGNAFGASESDPHNRVHVMVGGDSTEEPQGWMWDPNFAALDPIFWVHHCNVDRLWAAWMSQPDHVQESSRPWLNGPFPRRFTMPDPAGGLAIFVPADTLPDAALAPVYDDIVAGAGIAATTPGGPAMAAAATPRSPAGRSELVGANRGALKVGTVPVRSAVAMTTRRAALGAVGGERVYLSLEGVKGRKASGVLNVVLTAPGGDPAEAGPEAVRTLVFFGLANATAAEGPHGGDGLTETVEITDIARRLQGEGPLDAIEAHVAQPDGAGAEITVDRISVYVRPGP